MSPLPYNFSNKCEICYLCSTGNEYIQYSIYCTVHRNWVVYSTSERVYIRIDLDYIIYSYVFYEHFTVKYSTLHDTDVIQISASKALIRVDSCLRCEWARWRQCEKELALNFSDAALSALALYPLQVGGLVRAAAAVSYPRVRVGPLVYDLNVNVSGFRGCLKNVCCLPADVFFSALCTIG